MERRHLKDGKAIAKDVWQQLRSQAGESGAFSGIRETMERIMGRLKVGTVVALRCLKVKVALGGILGLFGGGLSDVSYLV